MLEKHPVEDIKIPPFYQSKSLPYQGFCGMIEVTQTHNTHELPQVIK